MNGRYSNRGSPGPKNVVLGAEQVSSLLLTVENDMDDGPGPAECSAKDVILEGADGRVIELSSLGARPKVRLTVGQSFRVAATGACAGRIGAGPRSESGPLASEDGVLFDARAPGSLEVLIFTPRGSRMPGAAGRLEVIARVEVTVVAIGIE